MLGAAIFCLFSPKCFQSPFIFLRLSWLQLFHRVNTRDCQACGCECMIPALRSWSSFAIPVFPAFGGDDCRA
jgi:hypothetical protein